MNGTVQMRSIGDAVRVDPSKRLSDPMFRIYRDACDRGGARFRREFNTQVAPMDRAPAVALSLEQAGFTVEVGFGVEVDLEAARSDRVAQVLDTITERIRGLQERGHVAMPFQVEGIETLAAADAFLLADEMGLGKTWQGAIALPDRARVVIVCPAGVKGVWLTELRKLRPEYYVQILQGRGSFRWPSPGMAVVLNPDILPEAVMPPGPIHLIADEAHYFKSAKAERTKRFRFMARQVLKAGGKVWLLTGTPLKNRPPDLWNVLHNAGLAEKAFGSWPAFCRLFKSKTETIYVKDPKTGKPRRRNVLVWGDCSPEVPELLRRVSLRRHRVDVLPDLPEKTIRDIPVLDLPHDTRQVCDEALAALERLGINLAEVHDLTELTKLQGADFSILAKARAALAVAKMPTMEELIREYEESNEPLVVFSAHRGPVEAAGSRKGWGLISGAVSPRHRTGIVEEFQAGHLRGIALTIGAGGIGLTLTHSPHALFVDQAWTPADNSQAEDRVYRIGQTRGVTITRLIADHPIDQHVTRLLDEKQKTISASVEASAVGAGESQG